MHAFQVTLEGAVRGEHVLRAVGLDVAQQARRASASSQRDAAERQHVVDEHLREQPAPFRSSAAGTASARRGRTASANASPRSPRRSPGCHRPAPTATLRTATATGSRKITIRCGLRNRRHLVVLQELVQIGHLEAPDRRLGVLLRDQRVEPGEVARTEHLRDLGIFVDRLVDMVAEPDASRLQQGGEHAGAGAREAGDEQRLLRRGRVGVRAAARTGNDALVEDRAGVEFIAVARRPLAPCAG